MVIGEASINNIMGGIENTGTVRLHNHKRKLKQRFVIIKKLGQGTYGKVQLGVNKETGQEVAIKTIKKSKIETEADLIRIRREIQIMSSVQHPNIIHIYEVFENREKMVLVMEYAAGGELYDYLSERKVLIESEARRIFRQIATACFYCHKHKICHRDLKLENILLDEAGNAKIADFGLSNVFDDQRLLSTFCGSPLYASPEIVKGTPYIGPEVDCWSLGVLLYTLVYGAMPFDGSNFKRLVRQISAADYSEPARPSPASPLIREMLAVEPAQRATIERVCAHWWVNEGCAEGCLGEAEALAAQTPVRLDLLLALAPPAQGAGSLRENLVVTGGEIPEEPQQHQPDTLLPLPTRSQSVGSIMSEMSTIAPAERRIKDMLSEVTAPSTSPGASPKRKLEPSVSSVAAGGTGGGLGGGGAGVGVKLAKDSTGADVAGQRMDVSGQRMDGLERSATQTLAKSDDGVMDVEEEVAAVEDKDVQGAACVEILKEQEAKQPSTPSPTQKQELPDKENAEVTKPVVKTPTKKLATKKVLGDKNTDDTTEKKVIKKTVKPKATPVPNKTEKVDTNVSIAKPEPIATTAEPEATSTAAAITATSNGDVSAKKLTDKVTEEKEPTAVKLSAIVARRRSAVFEQAEKLQNMLAPAESKTGIVPVEKPKKIIIPGVSVGGFKREFERKASLTSTSPPKLKTTPSKKLVINDKSVSIDKDEEVVKSEEKPSEHKVNSGAVNNKIVAPSKTKATPSPKPTTPTTTPTTPTPTPSTISPTSPSTMSPTTPDNTAPPAPTPIEPPQQQRATQLKHAVSIISCALEQEGARKSRSRPCVMAGAGRKPPVPFGIGGRSATCSMAAMGGAGGNAAAAAQKRELVKMHSIPAGSASSPSATAAPDVVQTATAEITLKSATLPRRKMTKAEIQLDYSQSQLQQSPADAQMEFRTEMAHRVEVPEQVRQQPTRKVATQRSEVTFPVFGQQAKVGLRSLSLEPESSQPSPKERIIPISFERGDERRDVTSPPVKPPTPRPSFTPQKSNMSQRTNSTLSRQSTLDSESGDTIGESTSSIGGEAIRKSAREYIIPIAVEGGGYVTPRATSLEPQTDATGSASTISGAPTNRGSTNFSRRWKSAFSDRDGSEDEDRTGFSPFQRYTSFGKDSDTEDRDPFHMHRLRSSRPYKATLEHTDSVSSGEDDDDDGFEILTAENLFSTLLSRVRDLTQRLKVDDSVGRPGFPTSRLLSQFDHGSNFFSNHPPLTRNSPLGRSFNREHSVSASVGGAHTTGGTPSQTGAAHSTPWRRSVSRDLAHDIQSVFGRDGAGGGVGTPTVGVGGTHHHTGPTVTATLPRGAEDILCQNH